MMDELISEVSQKTGLSPDQTQAAVYAVIGFLKERLPGPLASHLDGLVGAAPAGDAAAAAGGGGLASEATAVLGSLFGKK